MFEGDWNAQRNVEEALHSLGHNIDDEKLSGL
jgi:hypothetical protein